MKIRLIRVLIPEEYLDIHLIEQKVKTLFDVVLTENDLRYTKDIVSGSLCFELSQKFIKKLNNILELTNTSFLIYIDEIKKKAKELDLNLKIIWGD